jgi:hypothetical protein
VSSSLYSAMCTPRSQRSNRGGMSNRGGNTPSSSLGRNPNDSERPKD